MTIANQQAMEPVGYSWKRIAIIARQHRREIILANVIAIIATLLSVPVPLLMPMLVDEVLLKQPGMTVAFTNSLFPEQWHGPMLYIVFILVVTLVLRLGSLILGVWQMRQFTLISKDINFQIRRKALLFLQNVSMSEYETLGSGKVSSLLITDLDVIDQFVGSGVSKFLIAVLTITGTGVILLWMNWQLGLFILFLNPFVVYLTTVLGKRVKELKRKENKAYEVFQQAFIETLDAIQQIRAANREKHYMQRMIENARGIQLHSTTFAWKSDAANRFSFVIFLFGFDLFRAVSMMMVVYSDLTIGQMFAVFGYLWFMMGPVQEVLNIQYAYHSANAALERINQIFKLHLEPKYPHNKNPFKHSITTSICLDQVGFSYYEEGPAILDGISFTIPAGQKVAIVGASGAGKTTLVQVLLGLYPPKKGMMYFDKIPLDEIGLDTVRDHVAVVLQHPVLFNDTIRMNLTLGRDIADAQLWHALKVAQLDDVVIALEQQFDTLVGKQGIRLSGGQRQRLAIARMVLTQPHIVILDEATSALDSDTEGKLHTSLGEFLAGRTTIIIAHRLSAVRQADKVLVFDGGRVIEQGVHEDLMEINGLYAKLYKGQIEK